MPVPAHPLATLVGPLRYACQRDFARLPSVRQLRPVIETALKAAEGSHVRPETLAALRGELQYVDAPSLEARKQSLTRVLSALKETGLEFPPDVPGRAQAPIDSSAGPLFAHAANQMAKPVESELFGAQTKPTSTMEVTAAVPASSAPTRDPQRKRAPGATEPQANRAPELDGELFEEEAPPEPARRGKTKKVSTAEIRAEARLLSIAPRDGALARPLKELPWRLNPRLIATLNKKGVRKIGDILFMLPRAYEDRRRLKKISELIPGERGVTVGVVKMAAETSFRGRRRIFKAVVGDETGSLAATYFQSGPWLKARFPIGKRLIVSGELRATMGGREMAHPEVEPLDDEELNSVHFGRIVPIYPGFERHEQRSFRQLASRIVENYVQHLEEPLPEALRNKLGLLPLQEAIRRIHFPADDDDLDAFERHVSPAHQRLAFDELFFLQLGMSLKRQGIKTEPGVSFNVSDARMEKALAALPFELTRAQSRVVKQIAKDMGKPEPMHRLLQGDVGSGKTAVALVSAALALQDGFQAAIMAPTEILAEQHYRTAQKILEPLGYPVGLITAGGTAKQKRERREDVASGKTRFAVGTHALITGQVEFDKLGLVVIDEQHRFGVIQRHALMAKGIRPDVLVMTATPIPRTLAMTMYGDLEVSLIDELPPGRTPISTKVFIEKQRPRVYELILKELDKGHQAYVVYPLVEESEKIDLADATRGASQIQAAFPNHRVGLLHGRMSPEEKDDVMADFREGRTHILVCTTVVEVGVDVPNASVMVIESAERFGLSQLHQLRGRVGRGAAASFCFLVAGFARSKEASDRLQIMEKSTDGFVIAEKDLELRGPGEFLGTRQSGIPELAVANLGRDVGLLEKAQREANQIISVDPRLQQPEHLRLAKALEERWEGRLALARVG
ncbi:MAG: ATP-dependent DNA helicase RecG [Myxococcaceae bacterium]